MHAAQVAEATGTGDRATTTVDRILAALVEVILEGGLPGFSVQEVADLAGVAHRTVYRHFPTREALLEGLSDAVGRRMDAHGGIDQLGGLDEVPLAVLANYALFFRDARAVEASVRFGVSTAIETRDQQQRTARFRDLVAEGVPGTTAADAAMAGAVIRQVTGSRAWLGLREAGLDGEEAARAAAWAVTVLIDALHAGRTPSEERFPSPSSAEEAGS